MIASLSFALAVGGVIAFMASRLAVARRAADDALRNAGSPDHVEIVSRSVLYTDWTELG